MSFLPAYVRYKPFAQLQKIFFQMKKQKYKLLVCDMLKAQLSPLGVLTG